MKKLFFLGCLCVSAMLFADDFQPVISFNGSSTLAPVIASISTDYIEKYETWNKVNPVFPDKNIIIFVSSGGSGAGVKSVLDGTSNFGMLAREVKDTEKAKIKNFKEYKLGIDALTVSVNPKNPILKIKESLSTEELQKIFSGAVTTWKQLDSRLPNKEIVVVTRDLGGGAHEVFQKKIMGSLQVKKDAIQAPSMGALVQKVISNEYAIGYASFGIVNQNAGKLIPMKVDNVAATKANIVSGAYKISRPLIVVQSGEPNAAQKAFLEVLQGSEGSEKIEKMGFVPVK